MNEMLYDISYTHLKEISEVLCDIYVHKVWMKCCVTYVCHIFKETYLSNFKGFSARKAAQNFSLILSLKEVALAASKLDEYF